MMGRENTPQSSLFYTGINLDKRVRSDHVLRKVARLVEFDFVYGEVKESYGYNGNVSVPPPMILKLMLLLVLYNVRFFFQAEDGIRDKLVTGVQTCVLLFQAEDGIRDKLVTGVQTCALPIWPFARSYRRMCMGELRLHHRRQEQGDADPCFG